MKTLNHLPCPLPQQFKPCKEDGGQASQDPEAARGRAPHDCLIALLHIQHRDRTPRSPGELPPAPCCSGEAAEGTGSPHSISKAVG